MANHNIKIVTFNINGVLNPIKRSKILSKIKKENAHVVFLQETNLNSVEHEKLKRMGFFSGVLFILQIRPEERCSYSTIS